MQHLTLSCDAFFVLPADHPFVQPETIRSLMNAFRRGEGEIYRPCLQGRRGHPPLVPATLIPAILSFEEPGGLKALLARYEVRTANVACGDPGILRDLDTREDYDRAKETISS